MPASKLQQLAERGEFAPKPLLTQGRACRLHYGTTLDKPGSAAEADVR